MSRIANIFHTIIGAIAVFVAVNVAKRFAAARDYTNHLVKAKVAPGPWFAYYTGDFMIAHETDTVTSCLVELRDGTFLWATETPEWDREWFGEHLGWEFPERWVPYSALADYGLEPTEMG
ncbi:hypothetical protein [Mycobacterium sp. AZCC_0083]|uniref:hypothetical protein n=1 Tax=Mycobacterium sp. AZCC_0083 TaxID=2735882 RepID=UPI00161E71CD|nr:hypothetical protein [Mycobacterium sp. AZCC_0083]MBB5167156.1 hypothetical protein [Mycobacterium sp. AZCC_0083]